MADDIDEPHLNADEGSHSPCRTPPLLHNVSGNESSSGSPAGSRRHGSLCEKEKRNREERLKLIKERQEQEHEKRLSELRAAYEKETRIRQMKDAERLRRIQEIKAKEAYRRQAVEERRRRLESEGKEKREQILAKYKEYEQRFSNQRDQKKPIYAFGSSTPRTLAYLEHLDNSMRVYNSRPTTGVSTEPDATIAKPPPVGTPVSKSGTPNTTHCIGQYGGSMVTSMYGGSIGSPAHSVQRGRVDRDPLASARSMTASFAVGESCVPTSVRNVRTKGTTSPSTPTGHGSSKSSRALLPSGKPRQPDMSQGRRGSAANRIGSDSGGDAGQSPMTKVVSSSRTPSAPPPIRRPNADSARQSPVPAASSKTNVSKEERQKGNVEETRNNVEQPQEQIAVASLTPNVENETPVESPQGVGDYEKGEENLDDTSLSTTKRSAVVNSSANQGVPKPTGQGTGKVLSKEEATAALAERRRLAREQQEKERELERQKEEQRMKEEEEARIREEEEFRRQEQEELRMLEEARQREVERIQKLVEEEEKKRQMEAEEREVEQRKKAEAEARAKEEADRLERERKEAEEKFKREEEERMNRKKRLEAIMQRTRTPGAASSSSAKQSPNSSVINVNGNESVYFTPDTQAIPSSENVVNMETSTVDTNAPVASDSSVSIGDSSMYDTPIAKGFNQGERTEYDMDAAATQSQSEFASVLPNQATSVSHDNQETAALGSMLGIHSPSKANGDSIAIGQQLAPRDDPFGLTKRQGGLDDPSGDKANVVDVPQERPLLEL